MNLSPRKSRSLGRVEVVFTPSEEIQRLRREMEDLRSQLTDLRTEFNRVQLLYMAESHINGELQDLLREHGISYRDAIAQYRGMV